MKKLIKNKWFWWLITFGIILPSSFFYGLWRGVQYVEDYNKRIAQEGWEIGYQVGLETGTNNAYDDFYATLSTNPKVTYLFKKYFPQEEEARIMRAISLAESKGVQTAVNKANRNGSIDSGFFQVNTIHKKKGETKEQFIERMHNLEENFKEARRVLDTQGLSAWSTYNSGAYLSYIQ